MAVFEIMTFTYISNYDPIDSYVKMKSSFVTSTVL